MKLICGSTQIRSMFVRPDKDSHHYLSFSGLSFPGLWFPGARLRKNTHTTTRSYSGGGIILVVTAMFLSAFYAALNWSQENWRVVAVLSIFAALFFLVALLLKSRSGANFWRFRAGFSKNQHRKVLVEKEVSNSSYWLGRPVELLVDSLGPPHAVDYKVLKSGIVETWIYCDQRSGMFTLNIVVENGTIVEWIAKSAEQSADQ